MKKLIIVVCVLLSCNEKTVDNRFGKKTNLATILSEVGSSNWNSTTQKSKIVSEVDWLEFKEQILLNSGADNKRIKPREELVKFLNDSFDTKMTLIGLVIKERFYSGVKLKYQVVIGLITDTVVLVYKYDFLSTGFSLVEKSKLTDGDYRNWIEGLTVSDKLIKSPHNIVYCLSIFTASEQFSELVFNSNYIL